MWWRMPPQKKLSSFWVFGFSAKFGVFDPTGILLLVLAMCSLLSD
jgi:hypothetical protein